MKLILTIFITLYTFMFSGCEAYERHKQIELEKSTVQKSFNIMNTKKEVIISTKKIITVEGEEKSFYKVYEGNYIKSLSFEKIKTFYDEKESYVYIVKIILDDNQFNLSDKKTEDKEIKLKVNEKDKDFIMNIFNSSK